MIEDHKEIDAKKIESQKKHPERRIEASREKYMLENKLMVESVKICQDLALECGVTPDSVEFYACRVIFKESYDRAWFCNPEARLQFLQRYCQENKLY
ncbi:unnamed protein product [Urochloa humidicola]